MFGPVDAVATTGASIDNSVPVSVTLVETILSGFDVISTGPFGVSTVRGQLPCDAAESASESAPAELQPTRANPATKTAESTFRVRDFFIVTPTGGPLLEFKSPSN